MVNFEEQARELVRRCSRANSETTVASRIEEILRDVLKEYGIDYQPIREKRVVRRGRIDSIFGAVVTEYKKRIENPAEWEEVSRPERNGLSRNLGAVLKREGRFETRFPH